MGCSIWRRCCKCRSFRSFVAPPTPPNDPLALNSAFSVAWDGLKFVTLVGETDDYLDPDFATITGWRFDMAALLGLSGIVNTVGGAQTRWIFNDTLGGTNINMTLRDEDIDSAPANRFNLPNSANYILRPGMGVLVIYDTITSRWHLQSSGRL